MSADTARGFLFTERKHSVTCTAKLKGAYLLQVLTLEKHLCTNFIVQAFIGQDGRSMDIVLNPPRGFLNFMECDSHELNTLVQSQPDILTAYHRYRVDNSR